MPFPPVFKSCLSQRQCLDLEKFRGECSGRRAQTLLKGTYSLIFSEQLFPIAPLYNHSNSSFILQYRKFKVLQILMLSKMQQQIERNIFKFWISDFHFKNNVSIKKMFQKISSIWRLAEASMTDLKIAFLGTTKNLAKNLCGRDHLQ